MNRACSVRGNAGQTSEAASRRSSKAICHSRPCSANAAISPRSARNTSSNRSGFPCRSTNLDGLRVNASRSVSSGGSFRCLAGSNPRRETAVIRRAGPSRIRVVTTSAMVSPVPTIKILASAAMRPRASISQGSRKKAVCPSTSPRKGGGTDGGALLVVRMTASAVNRPPSSSDTAQPLPCLAISTAAACRCVIVESDGLPARCAASCSPI